ncbi:Protein of unknown function [Cotesia congregata]|uniref:CCHC-type domain-containing protein n=1 Tax=Cotesia congregata TaxID=51543 RepID=A0A8J2H0H1_COTCN|nr:Protein of unknown function [Cotesia congregata]
MDDFYDTDLEARLYAEVHYTNDSYSEGNIDPRALAPEGDVPPGSIRSYAKKTGMIPKKHRALIDGPRTVGNHRMQEPAPRQEFSSPRFASPNPSRLNIPISSRLGPPISTGFTPLDSNRPNLFGNYPPDYPRSGHLLDPTAINFDNSRLPPYMYNQAPNFQLNPYASDNFNLNLLDPYSSPRQDLPHFNQPDFIRLTHSSPNRSKAQSRKDSHMANLKDFAKKVRNRRKREKTRKNRKLFKGNKNSIAEINSSTPRKNPDRAARCPDLNKSGDGTKDVVNLDDSIEVVEIQESANDNLTQSNLESQVGNDEMSQGESVDDLDDSEESLDKSEGKLDDNLDKSGDGLEKSDNSDKSKNLDTPNSKGENLKTPNRNLDKFNKNLDQSSKNLDKSNDNLKTPSKNLDKSNQNLDKTNNLNKSDENLTPSKNLDKSNKNQDKSDEILTPSKNMDKSNKNSDKSNRTPEKSGHNYVKSKTLEPPNKSPEKSDGNSKTPSKNVDKSNPNLDKPDENLDKSNSPQKSGTPENKDTNMISKSSPEPSSKDKNSKYNIKSPSKFSKSMATLDSSSDSDSDESIFEVPAKDDPKVLETITDTTEATASTTTTIISEDSGGKSRQSASKSLDSDKKRPRDESRNRDNSLKPIKVPRSDKSKDNTSFEEYVSKPMPVTLKAFYTDYRSSGCMNDVIDVQHKMSRNPNLWAILDADLVCRGGDKRLRCSFCHQPGHKRENCPDKKKPTLCHIMGHLKTNCPDLWRRYHQTTTSEGVNIPPDLREVLKPSHKLYCCNCTRRGHESSTCSRYRWSSHFPSPISVTSYTEGPSYPIIEPVEIPPEIPIPPEVPIPLEAPTPPEVPIPPQVPDPPAREEILFHYQNYRVIPEDWCSDTIYPLEIPNISYDLESSKNHVPRFLTKHFPEGCHCYIYVHIKLRVPDKLVVELKTPSAPSTLELKKLMVQWMSRRKEDRNKMTLTQRLPVNKALLLKALLDKFYDFITNSSFRGLLAYDFEVEKRTSFLSSKMESCRVNSIQASKFKNRLKAVEPRYLKKLICSLYNFKLAPSAEAIINDFQKLLSLLSSDNAWEGDHGRDSLVPQAMYMSFCWFNFELFTLHLSDYLVHAKNLLLERIEQLKMRNIKQHMWAPEMGLELMFKRSQRVNFLSEGFKPGVLKPNKIKERHRQLARGMQTRANARTKNKRNKNNSNNDSKNSESGNDDSSWNNDSSQNIGGSGNNDSFKNTGGSGNNKSFKNTSGSWNNESSKNASSSGNSGSSRNTGGSGNGGSSKNIAGFGNSGFKNSDGSRKPKEKPTSLIVDGKINLEILQREKLACRAQAAVDLAKKHGLRDYADRAELMVRKIKSGGMVKKNAIEQLWSLLVKELRGNNISVQN